MYLKINPLLKEYANLSGLTQDAIRCKIRDGYWVEGKQYVKAPDGKIRILLEGVDKWDRGEE